MAIETVFKRQRSTSANRMSWNSTFGSGNVTSIKGPGSAKKIKISPLQKRRRKMMAPATVTERVPMVKATQPPQQSAEKKSFLTNTMKLVTERPLPASTPAPDFGVPGPRSSVTPTKVPVHKATRVAMPKLPQFTDRSEPSPVKELPHVEPSPVKQAVTTPVKAPEELPTASPSPAPMSEDKKEVPMPPKVFENVAPTLQTASPVKDKEEVAAPSPKRELSPVKEPAAAASPMAMDASPSPCKRSPVRSPGKKTVAGITVPQWVSPVKPAKKAAPASPMGIDGSPSPGRKTIAGITEPEDTSFEVDSASPATVRSPSSEFVAWWDESDAKIEMRRSMIRMSTHSRKSVTFRSPLTIVRESVSPSPSPSPIKMSASPVPRELTTRLSFSTSASPVKSETAPSRPVPVCGPFIKKTRSVSKSASRSRSRSKSASPAPNSNPLTRAELSKLKVVELKEILKGLGLSPYGLKAELVTRVLEAGYCGEPSTPAAAPASTPKKAAGKGKKTPAKTPKKTPARPLKTISPIELNNIIVEAHKEGTLMSLKPSQMKQWLVNNDVDVPSREPVTLATMISEVLTA
eukprot:TRINITY_DN192_c0_g1_i2.p1 TRINITY_DN192_c0_g1~~TRINITY_DN192_c0_g1_i2.p1  ORF type:complete len:576 (+),score=141.10 TRINITY_DN192_c0_g1_i2:56-1783(+)